MNKGTRNLITVAIACVLVLCFVASIFIGGYNNLVTQDESAKNQWSQVQTQYQRRSDVAEQLVASASAGMQEEIAVFKVLRDQAAALSGTFKKDEYGQPIIPEGEDARKLEESIANFDQALINAIAFTADNPEMFSGDLISDLMVQLEGGENRVSNARRDYNNSVTAYRMATRRFPAVLFATIFGFNANRYPYFQADEGAQSAPSITFPTPNTR